MNPYLKLILIILFFFTVGIGLYTLYEIFIGKN